MRRWSCSSLVFVAAAACGDDSGPGNLRDPCRVQCERSAECAPGSFPQSAVEQCISACQQNQAVLSTSLDAVSAGCAEAISSHNSCYQDASCTDISTGAACISQSEAIAIACSGSGGSGGGDDGGGGGSGGGGSGGGGAGGGTSGAEFVQRSCNASCDWVGACVPSLPGMPFDRAQCVMDCVSSSAPDEAIIDGADAACLDALDDLISCFEGQDCMNLCTAEGQAATSVCGISGG